jgi:hypothetical protein
MSSPEYHKAGAAELRRDRERAAELAALIVSRTDRWEALEALAVQAAGGGRP